MEKGKIDIVLVGGGGHCKSCIEAIESTNKYNIIGILDLPSEIGKSVLNYQVIGTDIDFKKFIDKGYSFLVTAGQIKSVTLRKRIFDNLEKLNAKIETIVASSAVVSEFAAIGKGSIVMHGSIINAGAVVGKNCIINTSAVLEHDSHVGQNCHISTTAVINGDCYIGDDVFIGSAACVSNSVRISSSTLIGAGSVVTKDITEKGTYVGVPAIKI